MRKGTLRDLEADIGNKDLKRIWRHYRRKFAGSEDKDKIGEREIGASYGIIGFCYSKFVYNIMHGVSPRNDRGFSEKVHRVFSECAPNLYEAAKEDESLFSELVIYIGKSANTSAFAANLGIEADESVSDRNVSASRLAEDMGLDFVMKSKTGLLTGADGKKTKVNL